MNPKVKSRTALISVVISILIGIIGWKHFNQVDVDIRSYHPNSTVTLSRVSRINPKNIDWFPISEGPNRLAKGTYFFKLAYADQVKTGLIAIADESSIALK